MIDISGHAVLDAHMSVLRCSSTQTDQFRLSMKAISAMLAVDATSDLPTWPIHIDGPLERTTGFVLDSRVVAVPILRAGLGMKDGFQSVVGEVDIGYIGVERQGARHMVYYDKLPDLEGAHIFLLDPMLATGGSAAAAVSVLEAAGGRNISLLSVIAAPEGVDRLNNQYPGVRIFTAGCDRGLDEDLYIRPGLGDAGDRLYG